MTDPTDDSPLDPGQRAPTVEELFEAAVALPAAQRSDYLAKRTDDQALRREVKELLGYDDGAPTFGRAFEDAAASVAADLVASQDSSRDPDRSGSVIDGYELIERVGVGGFGSVYKAQQREPIERLVALKLARTATLTEEGRRRFELESQTLARVEHPNIAKVYDAGADAEGRPYFVMEYLDGATITRFCAEHDLELARRLELFCDVGRAVAHAHQRGIIHRDLKPSNVLVVARDDEPQVKVIDFGVAKAVDPDDAAAGLTRHRQIVGTLEYLSPEQASLDADVDTRSDVYCLGVLLYELLTGGPPFDRERLSSSSTIDALRTVREVDPERPSSRTRAQDPSLARRLRGDLDWVVMKALEKDPERRYQSASELSAEIDRFLTDQPVEARPPSTGYRAAKFVRRHRALVVSSVAIGLALVLGLGAALLGLSRAARERDRAVEAETRARQEAAVANEVSTFLVDLFESADPSEALGEELRARTVLDVGARRIDGLDAGPVPGRLRSVMGRVYRGLGLYDHAEPLLERVAAEQEGSPEARVAALLDLAELRLLQDRIDEADSLLEAAQEIAAAADDNSLRADTLDLVGMVRYRQSDGRAMREALENSISLREQVVAAASPEQLESAELELADTLLLFAEHRVYLRVFPEAEDLLHRAAAVYARHLDPLHPARLDADNRLVHVLANLRKSAEALPLAEHVVERSIQVLGAEHPGTAAAYASLGSVHYRATLDQEAALEAFERALEIYRSTLGPEHRQTMELERRRAFALAAADRLEEAIAVSERVLAHFRRTLGDEHNEVLREHFNLGMKYQRFGDHQRAETHLRRHLTGYHDNWFDDFQFARPMNALATTLVALRRFDEAERLLLRAAELLEEERGVAFFGYRIQTESLIDLYTAWGRDEEVAIWTARRDASLAAEQASAAENEATPSGAE